MAVESGRWLQQSKFRRQTKRQGAQLGCHPYDAGFMVDISEQTRRSFAEFFLAIAFRDGCTAAKIVRETALRISPNLDVEAFDIDIAKLIDRVGGLKARDIQLTGFVGELFAIMRKHHIYGTSQFTLIILSLLVYEGVTKQKIWDSSEDCKVVPNASIETITSCLYPLILPAVMRPIHRAVQRWEEKQRDEAEG